MKSTPLTTRHIALGARMADFAGYNMPIVYSSITEEHLTVRSAAGLFDVSHMGEFILTGEKASQLIQHITSNDVTVIKDGQAQYTCMPNSNGGIVDDLIIYRFSEDKWMMVVNAANMEKDWKWVQQHNHFDVELDNVSENMALLALQGPKANACLQALTSVNLENIAFYHFEVGTVAGVDNVIISATGYTGSGGFELYAPNEHAEKLWNAILKEGEQHGIRPVGLAARDTLRLEMGYCLYGNDIDDSTNPIEAGLGWITKLDKPFVASDIIGNVKAEGVTRRLRGFMMKERGIPRQGHEIVTAEGEVIGKVTSGTQSPSLNEAIGMGYIAKEHAKFGNEVFISNSKKAGAGGDREATVL